MTAESPRQRRSPARRDGEARVEPAAPIRADAAAPAPIWRKLLGLDETESAADEDERRRMMRRSALAGGGFIVVGPSSPPSSSGRLRWC
jgi:hypothetical protein